MTTSPDPNAIADTEDRQKARPTINIFYSYADKDEKWHTELHTHLVAALGATMDIQESSHKAIQAGQNENRVIKRAIRQAQLILLLISPDFVQNEHQNSVEMQEIKNILRQDRRKKGIIPILVRPVLRMKNSLDLFDDLVRLPSNQIPVKLWLNKHGREKAYVDIVEGIRKFIEDSDNKLVFKPFSLIPGMNPHFTGRESVLKQLFQTLAKKLTKFSLPLALYGLGGVGKTQLAITYAHRYHDWYTNVFLMNADTRELLLKDCTTVAEGLDLVKKKDKKDAADQNLIMERMRIWLETHENWLLILDNVRDETIFQEFIPDEVKGHILLTTQKTAWSGFAEKLEIETLPVDEGVTLLLRRARDKELQQNPDINDQDAAREIVDSLLGRLPLAIDQAGAYIAATGCGLTGYKQLFKKRRRVLLATRGKTLATRDEINSQSAHPDSVVTTFLLAFERLEQDYPLAADLLRLCAFLAPDAIPQTLFSQYLVQLPYFSSRASQDITFEDASAALRKYSLIHRDTRSSPVATLTIHRLVQAVMHDEMDERTQRAWAIRAVNLVGLAFPSDISSAENWPQCQWLLPHAMVCARLIGIYNLTTSHASRLLDDSGFYLFQRGLYREAKPLYEQALAIREQNLGPRDVFVARSLHHLGELNKQLGDYTEAEQQLRRALDIRGQTLEPIHPDIASNLNGLAEVYRKQQKYDQAKQLYEQALDIYRQVPANNLQSAGVSPHANLEELVKLYNNLAHLHQDTREYDKADELYHEALRMAKDKWGEEHPITAQILHDQAELYKKQRKFKEAEQMHLMVLDIRKRVAEEQRKLTDTGSLQLKKGDTQELVQDVTSFDIAMSLHSLGSLYMRIGEQKKAEEFYDQAIKMRKKVLGLEHPETAESMYRLAKLYRNQRKVQESTALYRGALAILEMKPGIGDFHTLEVQKSLADFYQSLKRSRDAESLYQEALASRYRLLRLDNPTIERNVEYLSKLYTTQNKTDEVEQLYKDAFSRFGRRFGPDDPLTQHYRQKLVELYKKGSNRDGKLAWLYVQVFDLRARNLRGDTINSIKEFIQSVKDLTELYKSQNQTKRLKELYDLALHICHRQLGATHPVTLWYQDAFMNIPDNARKPSNHQKYRPRQKPRRPSNNNGQTSLVLKSLEQTGEISTIPIEIQQEEEQRLEQKLQKASEQSGVDDPEVIKLRHELAQKYEQQERLEEAEHLYKHALFICTLELGSDHAATIECQNDLVRFYWSHGKYDEAKPLIQDVLAICLPMLEKTNLSTDYVLAGVHTLDNAAFLYLRQLDTRQLYTRRRNSIRGAMTKPEVLLQQALAICNQTLGKEHPETRIIHEHYAHLLQDMGLYDEAEVFNIQATTMQKRAAKQASTQSNLEEAPHV